MRVSYQTDTDPHTAIIEQVAMVVVALQDTVHGLSQRIDR